MIATTQSRTLNRQEAPGSIHRGLQLRIAGRDFEVGAYVHELGSWDLIQDGQRAMTIRPEVLVAVMDPMCGTVSHEWTDFIDA